MRLRLLDGDRVVLDREYASLSRPLGQAVIVPAFSKDGRCVCTMPAAKYGPVCVQRFHFLWYAMDGAAMFVIDPRANAVLVSDDAAFTKPHIPPSLS